MPKIKNIRFAGVQIFVDMVNYYSNMHISCIKKREPYNKSFLTWIKKEMCEFYTANYSITKDEEPYLPNNPDFL